MFLSFEKYRKEFKKKLKKIKKEAILIKKDENNLKMCLYTIAKTDIKIVSEAIIKQKKIYLEITNKNNHIFEYIDYLMVIDYWVEFCKENNIDEIFLFSDNKKIKGKFIVNLIEKEKMLKNVGFKKNNEKLTLKINQYKKIIEKVYGMGEALKKAAENKKNIEISFKGNRDYNEIFLFDFYYNGHYSNAVIIFNEEEDVFKLIDDKDIAINIKDYLFIEDYLKKIEKKRKIKNLIEKPGHYTRKFFNNAGIYNLNIESLKWSLLKKGYSNEEIENEFSELIFNKENVYVLKEILNTVIFKFLDLYILIMPTKENAVQKKYFILNSKDECIERYKEEVYITIHKKMEK